MNITREILHRIDRLERLRTRLTHWLYANAPSRTGKPCARWKARQMTLETVESEIRALLMAL